MLISPTTIPPIIPAIKPEITFASEAIAKKALPKCHIVCYTNDNMRNALEGFLQVLYDQNPKSVGGSMPKDDFYYEY